MNYTELLAITSNVLIIISCLVYIRGILKKEITPHAFTWFVWGVILAISFAAQYSDGAGIGSYISIVDSILCFFIFLLALKYGVKHFPLFDWIALSIGLLGIVLWQLTSTALYAAIMVSIADLIAWLPTYRKSWNAPHNDSVATFIIGLTAFILSILVLENYSLTTWLYPASVIFTNSLFIVTVLIRRKQLRQI